MTTVASDLRKLRWHLALAALALLISALLVLWGLRYDRESHTRHNAATERLRQAETRLQQASGEEEEIRQKASLFLQLQKSGVFGPEKRLDWTEMLAELPARLRLPFLEYEFAPQTQLEGGPSGGHVFYRSTMKLRLGLLHEEDLLRALHLLENEARALVVVRSCKIERRLAPSSPDGPPAHLGAECEIEWITARPAEKAQ